MVDVCYCKHSPHFTIFKIILSFFLLPFPHHYDEFLFVTRYKPLTGYSRQFAHSLLATPSKIHKLFAHLSIISLETWCTKMCTIPILPLDNKVWAAMNNIL